MCDVCAGGLLEDQIDLDEMERKIIMKKLYDAIDFLHDKSVNKRIQEKEVKFVKLRVDMFKAMAYLSTSYNILARDMELEQIREELEGIKQIIGK